MAPLLDQCTCGALFVFPFFQMKENDGDHDTMSRSRINHCWWSPWIEWPSPGSCWRLRRRSGVFSSPSLPNSHRFSQTRERYQLII